MSFSNRFAFASLLFIDLSLHISNHSFIEMMFLFRWTNTERRIRIISLTSECIVRAHTWSSNAILLLVHICCHGSFKWIELSFRPEIDVRCFSFFFFYFGEMFTFTWLRESQAIRRCICVCVCIFNAKHGSHSFVQWCKCAREST